MPKPVIIQFSKNLLARGGPYGPRAEAKTIASLSGLMIRLLGKEDNVTTIGANRGLDTDAVRTEI